MSENAAILQLVAKTYTLLLQAFDLQTLESTATWILRELESLLEPGTAAAEEGRLRASFSLGVLRAFLGASAEPARNSRICEELWKLCEPEGEIPSRIL